jgi:chromate transporter
VTPVPVTVSRDEQVSLARIALEWSRIGVIGFGGPPAHIALLRALCVERRQWLDAGDFEAGIAATNLLPGPASTQLAILCAWKLRGRRGAVVGGVCFIVPGLVVVLALAALFLAHDSPRWVQALAVGTGSGVPAVAVSSAVGLVPASWRRVTGSRARQCRWLGYLLAGGVAGATVGQDLVLVLAACGLCEAAVQSGARRPRHDGRFGGIPVWFVPSVAGGWSGLSWVAFKVGALSYGGGFVIIPLMRHDAVTTYRWMSDAQFLNAVALGQITPGPVVHTVAVVGYAAGGLTGALVAAAVAFAPSFGFVLLGAAHLDRLQHSAPVRAFLTGAGACAIGGIAGVAVPLARSLAHPWNVGITVLAAVWLLGLRRGVVSALLGCALLGIVADLAHAPLT